MNDQRRRTKDERRRHLRWSFVRIEIDLLLNRHHHPSDPCYNTARRLRPECQKARSVMAEASTIEKRVSLSVERADSLSRLAQVYHVSENQVIEKALDILLALTD